MPGIFAVLKRVETNSLTRDPDYLKNLIECTSSLSLPIPENLAKIHPTLLDNPYDSQTDERTNEPRLKYNLLGKSKNNKHLNKNYEISFYRLNNEVKTC